MIVLTTSEGNIEYRISQPHDAAAITGLNHFWCDAFNLGSTEKGFLKNKFHLEQILSLIDRQECVVAEMNGRIVGYYLINTIYVNENINGIRKIVEELIANEKLENARYAYLTQAAVAPECFQKGIAKNLLKLLKEIVRDRFDYLLGVISPENAVAKNAHLRSGWFVIAKIQNSYLVVTPTHEF